MFIKLSSCSVVEVKQLLALAGTQHGALRATGLDYVESSHYNNTMNGPLFEGSHRMLPLGSIAQ